MKAIRIALALALLAHCSPAADIAPVVSWSVETDALQPSQRGRKDLEIVRGETVVLECQLLSGGAALNLAEATSVLLRYTPANPATNSTHYVVTGAVHNASTGKVRVRWTPAAAPAADRLQYEIAVGSTTSTVARAWGLLRLLPGVGDDSTGSAVERSTIDWSTVDSQNEGDGPWPVNLGDLVDVHVAGASVGDGMVYDGTNWVASAGSGDMSRLIYDTDADGIVDDAELFGGIAPSGYATTNYVSSAVAGVHSPVTLAPWCIGSLFGQRLGISSTNVMDAVAGRFVDIATGGVVTGIEARIEMTGGSSYIEAASGSFRNGLSVGATPVLTIASELDATKLAGVLPSLNGGSLTNLTAAAIVGTLPAISGANLSGVLHSISAGSIGSTEIANGSIAAADTAITGTPSGTKTLRDDWSWQEPAAPQWSVGWGPGEIIGPFYDGSNDAAGWSRTALDSGSYKVAGMGFSSSLTSLQDVTFYVTVFSPPNSTVLDTSKAIELTYWTTTASAADQKFDLYVYGSTVAMASPVLEYSSTGIVAASPNVPQTLTIAKASLSNPATIYRAYTFKVISYSKSTGKVNFIRGCVNGR